MAVFQSRQFSERKGYATMAESTVVAFEPPSGFSPDQLTEVIQRSARKLLRTAVQAKVSAFIASGDTRLLDETVLTSVRVPSTASRPSSGTRVMGASRPLGGKISRASSLRSRAAVADQVRPSDGAVPGTGAGDELIRTTFRS